MNKKYLSAIFLYDIIYILKERERSIMDTIECLLYYYEDDKTEQALDRMLNNEE